MSRTDYSAIGREFGHAWALEALKRFDAGQGVEEIGQDIVINKVNEEGARLKQAGASEAELHAFANAAGAATRQQFAAGKSKYSGFIAAYDRQMGVKTSPLLNRRQRRALRHGKGG